MSQPVYTQSVYSHHGHRWLVKAIVKFIKSAEDDARTQIIVHKIMMRFWMINFCVATFVFFAFPGFWATASIFYVTAISLYANFATDYGALNASQGSLHALEAGERITKEVLDDSSGTQVS